MKGAKIDSNFDSMRRKENTQSNAASNSTSATFDHRQATAAKRASASQPRPPSTETAVPKPRYASRALSVRSVDAMTQLEMYEAQIVSIDKQIQRYEQILSGEIQQQHHQPHKSDSGNTEEDILTIKGQLAQLHGTLDKLQVFTCMRNILRWCFDLTCLFSNHFYYTQPILVAAWG
jgi:hypothetical protein